MPNDTARGFDATLIGVMALGMARAKTSPPTNHPDRWDKEMATHALTALCAARPDVAALLAGEAVAVPREATHEMIKAGRNRPYREEDTHIDYTDRNTELTWGAMLATSPYYTNDR